MKPFDRVVSKVVPLRADNVDTDQIIPAKYLTTVSKKGLGKGCFHALRYQEDGTDDPSCPLNQPVYQGASILISGSNFGSGSSREHAVWALTDYGFRAVIASSFADIFYNNSLKNGLLPVKLAPGQVEELMQLAQSKPESKIQIDLEKQTVVSPEGREYGFSIDSFRKSCLLQGLDDLGYLLQMIPVVEEYEERVAAGI